MVTPTQTHAVAHQPSGISPLRNHNPNSDRYVWDLRGAYAGLRIWDPDFALSRDPWIYERMERDPLIRQCLWDRVSAVGGRDYAIVPPDDPEDVDLEAARVVGQIIGELKYGGFHAARINLARFLWYGATFAALYGKRKLRRFGVTPESREAMEESEADDQQQGEAPGDMLFRYDRRRACFVGEDGQPFQPDEEQDVKTPEPQRADAMEWWVPTRLRDISKRRVSVWREGGHIRRKLARILNPDGNVAWEWDEFPEDRIVAAIYDDQESRLGFGRGLGDACYWPFLIRWKIREEGYLAARTWMQGVIHGTIDGAAIGDTSQDNESVRDDLLVAIRDMKARGTIVTGETEDMKVLDGLGGGAEIGLQWDQRFSDDLRMVLTGAVLPTGGGGEVGSLARAGEEADTSEGQYQTDSALLDDAMTEGVVKPVWERNTENIAALGLEEARMPFFRSEGERHEDQNEVRENLKTARDIGLELVESEAYEKLGLTQPTAEHRANGDVLEAQQPDPFGFGGGEGSPFEDKVGASPFARSRSVIDAAAYAECVACGGARFGLLDGDGFPKWVSKALRKVTDAMRAMLKGFVRRALDQDAPTPEEAQGFRDDLADAMTDAMAAGDLEGTAEVLADIDDLRGTEDEGIPDLQPDDVGPTAVPRVPVGEAVQDVIDRVPEVAESAKAVAQAYRDGPAFAVARSIDANLTRKVQQVVADVVRDEGGLARKAVDELTGIADGWTRAYAETVVRTNVNTAMTEGRFRTVRENPNVRRVIGAFEVVTAEDVDVRQGRARDAIGKKNGPRENHAAAHGLVMGVDDPRWVTYATPYGYG